MTDYDRIQQLEAERDEARDEAKHWAAGIDEIGDILGTPRDQDLIGVADSARAIVAERDELRRVAEVQAAEIARRAVEANRLYSAIGKLESDLATERRAREECERDLIDANDANRVLMAEAAAMREALTGLEAFDFVKKALSGTAGRALVEELAAAQALAKRNFEYGARADAVGVQLEKERDRLARDLEAGERRLQEMTDNASAAWKAQRIAAEERDAARADLEEAKSKAGIWMSRSRHYQDVADEACHAVQAARADLAQERAARGQDNEDSRQAIIGVNDSNIRLLRERDVATQRAERAEAEVTQMREAAARAAVHETEALMKCEDQRDAAERALKDALQMLKALQIVDGSSWGKEMRAHFAKLEPVALSILTAQPATDDGKGG